MKSIIFIAIVLLGCIAFNEALKCYVHDSCGPNCPQLKDTIQTCGKDDNKCFKHAFVVGVKRGCAKERCNLQYDATSATANTCCETDLCNSAVSPKMTLSALIMGIGAFVLARM